MKFTTARRSSSTIINLTPLIDCMFLLVIFIFLAARFDSESGIPVDLPTAKTPGTPKVEAIHLTVTADGTMYLEDKEVSPENLTDELIRARTAAGDTVGDKIVLVILGDKDEHHGRVVEALDAATRAKQQKVTIRTKQ